MSVLVDTSVWSLALRRERRVLSAAQAAAVAELERLIREKELLFIGAVRQELLSGIRAARDFARLRAELRAFPDAPLQTADYERAAEFSNQCRSAGIACSNVDMLICAVAAAHDAAIFTTDADFERYAAKLSLRLHRAGR